MSLVNRESKLLVRKSKAKREGRLQLRPRLFVIDKKGSQGLAGIPWLQA